MHPNIQNSTRNKRKQLQICLILMKGGLPGGSREKNLSDSELRDLFYCLKYTGSVTDFCVMLVCVSAFPSDTMGR